MITKITGCRQGQGSFHKKIPSGSFPMGIFYKAQSAGLTLGFFTALTLVFGEQFFAQADA